MGYIYLKSGDIRITILLHLLNNTYAAFQMMFSESEVVMNIITIIYLIPIALGGLILAIKLVKTLVCYIKAKKNGEKIKTPSIKTLINKEELANYKYMFTNFTFITMVLLLGLEFALIEVLLRKG